MALIRSKAHQNSTLVIPLLAMIMFLARQTTSAFVHRHPLVSLALKTTSSAIVRHFSPPAIAPPEEVLRVFEKPNAVILDVRSQPEIDTQGFIRTNNEKNLWLQVNCTPQECPTLPDAADSNFPHKDTPVIIHCASGMRAGKAKEILDGMGYKDVVNAGGYADLGYLQDAVDAK